MHADQRVLIYSWIPKSDCIWQGSADDGEVLKLQAPPGQVFVVLVKRNQVGEDDVAGSIEKWNWVREDSFLPEAPVNWIDRYDEKLWSR